MLQTTALQYRYYRGPSLRFPDIQCQEGEHWLLLGQSGTGKTTLLHLLGGLLTPSSGAVTVGTTVLHQLSTRKLDQFRGKYIGIIFQNAHFVRSLNVEENLLLAQHLAGVKKDKKRIKNLLDRLNVGHKLHVSTDKLSIGEQQRVAIARALVNRPAVILADEPTSALDDDNCKQVADLLEEQARQVNATLMIVTHDNRLKSRFPKTIELAPQRASANE